MTRALKIIFAGSGEFGSPTLRMLVDGGFDVVRVYTQPDRPAGRGKVLTPTPIAKLAGELGLPVVGTADFNAEPLPPADVLLVIAFGQKIGDPAVRHPRLGSVNLHASRLPLYRGAAPINWAIIRGEQITGNSVIRLASKMDSGAILAQSELTIGPVETAGELHDRLAADGAPLVQRVLDDLAAGTSVGREQEHAAATQAPKLSRETAVLDWSQPAQEVVRRINGLSPKPGCHVQLLDASDAAVGRVTLLRARTMDMGKSKEEAGRLTNSGTISTGDGCSVEILEVQPQGKRPMSLNDYRRGNRWAAGLAIQSI
jgi:methionyl-tRNA formyltransferase